MFKILVKKELASSIKLYEVEAPLVARKCQPGQFVIIRTDEEGERIPLTIADFNRASGTITLIVQEVGYSTKELGQYEEGSSILDVAGPLGTPSHIENFGTVICVGGGIGVAPVYPIARAYKEAGNRVISIIGARNKDLVIWEDKMRQISDELIITTDDGSKGVQGLVTKPLKEILDVDKTVKEILAIGPVIMMKGVADTTRPYNIHTVVSLNPIMVDGTGMCGGCRVNVNNQNKFACVDGPEFDAHQVDFDGLMARQKMYHNHEKGHCQEKGGCKCQK